MLGKYICAFESTRSSQERSMRTITLLVGLMGWIATSQVQAHTVLYTTKLPAKQELKKLMDTYWEDYLQAHPLYASQLGFHKYDDKLGRVDEESLHKRHKRHQQLYKRLLRIKTTALDTNDQINYYVFKRQLHTQLQEFAFKMYLIPITNRNGFHVELARFGQRTRCKSMRCFQHYLARLQQAGRYIDEHIALMKKGVRLNYSIPKAVLSGFEDGIAKLISKQVNKSVFFTPFLTWPNNLSQTQKQQLKQHAVKLIQNVVHPALQRFYTFMKQTYIPHARKTIGASTLPNGKAFYAYRIRRFTTLPLTPKAVHNTGKREVARILKEMHAIIRKVKFKGTFKEFLRFLRTSPRFYAKTPQALLKETSYVLKRMDGQLPKLFKRLPRIPYGIKQIPAYIAPKMTTAYYSPPPGDGSRGGFYYVNTYNLKSRPIYEIQALSFHEAVPGHHLQLSIQLEQKNQHPLRTYFYFNAFIEGWALYAERLGKEVGFYKDPYSDFGRLTYEMWRACRLVVDTGIHAFGWSRQKAIDYMAQHTALSMHNITMEVDRYIAWPGQAVSYKMGELAIRALRKEAEDTLKERFDIRTFHDEVLKRGSLPLRLLQTFVRKYIRQTKTK
ncbi:MAG: DUF885 domain-containing protein [Deltaproteobacteria bacterium]|nr:DUF885 domain-containing protein [Deltaproteobacteria bacterium]MBU51618.1 DUF885 domain-containing protein [Deltaproteobacteria bacterium]